MDSADRALELAETLESIDASYVSHGHQYGVPHFRESAAILRWAAEVMRAEPKMLLGKEIIIKPIPPNLGDNNG